MKLAVITDMYAFAGDKKLTPPIPGTTNRLELDTEKDIGKATWDGWVQMERQRQPDRTVELTRENFRQALDQFLIFISGDRDNYPQVTDIREI